MAGADAAPEETCATRPPGARIGRKASFTRFGPRTFVSKTSAREPSAIPALLQIADLRIR